MSEIESQLADLETYVKKQTRYSERVNLIGFLGTLACCSVSLLIGIQTIPTSHQADIDKAVFVVFGSGHKSQDSQRPSDTVTVQRGELTKVLAEHISSDGLLAMAYLFLGGLYFVAIVSFFVRRQGTRHLVQAMGIITQLQGQSNTTETT